MRKLLTSRLTVFYKLVLPAIWGLINLGLMIFILIKTENPLSFLIILMLLPILTTIKLVQITYDDKQIYIYNWRTTKVYELKDVKAINEGSMTPFDHYFEIEILDKDDIVKFDFMPKFMEDLTFKFSKRYVGHLMDLRNKIIDSKKG
jgi:hypothetical protein